MAKKVIVISGGAATPHGKSVLELEFPQLQKALDEGYEIIESKQLTLAAGVTTSYYAVMLILEKK